MGPDGQDHGAVSYTHLDLTKEVACKALDDTLVMMDDVLEEITKYFKTLGREMTENNKKQAIMPSRATVFHNDAGLSLIHIFRDIWKDRYLPKSIPIS